SPLPRSVKSKILAYQSSAASMSATSIATWLMPTSRGFFASAMTILRCVHCSSLASSTEEAEMLRLSHHRRRIGATGDQAEAPRPAPTHLQLALQVSLPRVHGGGLGRGPASRSPTSFARIFFHVLWHAGSRRRSRRRVPGSVDEEHRQFCIGADHLAC